MNYWIVCFVLTVAACVSRSDLPAAEGLPAKGKQPVATPRLAGIGFETVMAGPLVTSSFEGATWTAEPGHAEILDRLARSGEQCLHLLGGQHSEIQFEVAAELANKNFDRLMVAAERWTSRAPFSFRVETRLGDKWQELYNGDASVKVGRPYLNRVEIPLPEGARRFRMTCTSPPGTGVLIDDLTLVEAKPMTVTSVLVAQQTAPILIGQKNSPVLQLEIEVEGSLTPRKLTSVEFQFLTGSEFLREVHFQNQPLKPGLDARFKVDVDIELQPGSNIFPLTCELNPDARLDESVTAICSSIQLDGKETFKLNADSSSVQNRIGVALRQRGDDGVNTYRIPGITTTNAGTLIAVYDNRNQAGGDLPGDIDVGMSRSTDGGQTWEPMRVIMDMGNDPKWNFDGIGDPSILTDKVTGDIWVAATWSHGNRSWHGSGPGMTPDETGQLMLTRSADDGKTWSKPINITAQVKANPKWRFVLQGPGNGITLRDGTLVFPAQFRGEDASPVNGKPFSTIIFSKDRGQTWTIGSGVKIDTTEAQIVQLGDDSIMINCRDNRGGSRSIYTTTDLGKTWTEHPTSRKALPEPVCNADILRVVHPKHGPLLFFSNPNTTRRRSNFTIKASNDEGMTWPEKWHTLYDERPGSGYSTLTQIDEDHIGVLYEGSGDLYFLRFSIDELLRK
jgi:sialidase-1